MIVALSSGRIDGYVSERPGALSAIASNPELTFVSFEEDKGFEPWMRTRWYPSACKSSSLLDKINAALEKLDTDTRDQMMNDAMTRQPLSE